MRIATRLFLSAVAILLITVGTLAFGTERWLRRNLEASFAEELEREARLIASDLPHDTSQLNAIAHRYGGLLQRRVTFIAADGRVLGDSDFDDASLLLLENHSDRPEVMAALRGSVATDRRRSESTNRDELKLAIPGWPGVVRVSAPLSQVEAAVRAAQSGVLVAGLLALVAGTIVAAIAARAVTRPLRELAVAARSVAAGNRPTYPEAGDREIRELILAFRAMDDDLATRMSSLQRRREETETLIESMVEGVAAMDEDANVMICNHALRQLFGFRPDQPLPNLRELFRLPEARAIIDQVLRGEPVLGKEVAFDELSVLITARPLPTGGAVLCVHDVTLLRRLEAVRRDFVANVSHELKTPLTSIAGYAETLLTDETDEATRRRFARAVLTNAQRMHRLIDDLLDLAKLESGRYEPEIQPLETRAAADAAWAPFAARAHERGVTFAANGASRIAVHADPEALRQILTNLFDNALRHTPSGGRIAVTARAVEGGATELTVSDTGSGIPTEHLARVFERFYRVDPHRSRDGGGTGLGLSIVKHLVEAHDGRVEIESAVGRGTTFRITFPERQAAQRSTPEV